MPLKEMYIGRKKNLKILIVEDYLVFARSVRTSLPEHEFIFARSVEEAVAQYQQAVPDITFLDINLPDGSGFDALQAIRQYDPNAYVVILTGNAQEDFVKQSQLQGAQGYIVKPPSKAKLEQYIDHYYAYLGHRANDTAPRPIPAPPLPTHTSPPAPPIAAKPPQAEEVQESKPSDDPLLFGLNILFVDAFEANRHRFTYDFSKFGCHVVAVENMEEALQEIAGSRGYQLVIVDCTAPGEEAYALSKEIRGHDKASGKKRFIIGLGKKSKSSQKWLVAGMNDYFQKPLQVGRLRDYIVDHLDEIME